MANFFQKNHNLVKILIGGIAALIICLLIASKVKSQKIEIDDSARQAIISSYQNRLPQMQKSPYQFLTSGISQLKASEPEMAVATLKQAVAKDKNYRDGWLYLGIAELEVNQTAEAILSLETAKTIDPIYALTYKYLSTAYDKTGQVEKAKECYTKYEDFSKK